MEQKINEIEINGIKYVPKSEINSMASSVDGMQQVLIRTYSAGVHFGFLAKRESTLAGIEVKLIKARRVFYWSGAASLSQMANDGVSKPSDCKFSQPVDSIDLVAIEIIPLTEKASNNLNKVAIWQV